MVHLANPGKLRPHSALPAKAAPVVKLEVEDQLEDEYGPLSKKPKSPAPAPALAPFQQQWGADAGIGLQPAQYSLFDEPSPLGLRLRKSPSLLDLIQMRLSQGNSAVATSCATSSGCFEAGKKKDLKSTAVSGATDKLKASNFPASILRIGSWECTSRYEGDLVAKCYYAKHKLVWEVLDGGLKSKIEIQWSDITALKGSCPEDGPGTLDIVLARQPLFFRETNPQPRKHTLWQATSDFTNGQASLHRRHFLQCAQGLLSKHFEKLIQCDPRLNSLSQQPEIILESPYFEPRCSIFEGQNESKCHGFDDLKEGCRPTMSGFQDHVSSSAAPSMTPKNQMRVPFTRKPYIVQRETLSPSSVMDTRTTEDNPTTSGIKESNDLRHWDQIKVPGLRSSMSMSDLVNHIGHCIAGHTTPGNPLVPTDSSLDKSVLEELTQYLLSDSQVTSASNEQFLMSRVNSLCCLIQHKDPAAAQTLQEDCNKTIAYNKVRDAPNDDRVAERKARLRVPAGEMELNDASGRKPGMSRKESYGELLLNLPRIASMPQFLFNIVEDSENQAR